MEREAQYLFKEIITENFQSLEKQLDIQVHQGKRMINYLNIKRSFPGNIILELSEVSHKEF